MWAGSVAGSTGPHSSRPLCRSTRREQGVTFPVQRGGVCQVEMLLLLMIKVRGRDEVGEGGEGVPLDDHGEG